MCKRIWGIDNATTNGTNTYMDSNGNIHIPTYPSTMPSGMPMLFMYDRDGNEWAGDQVVAQNGLIQDPAAVCRSAKMKLREEQIILSGRSFTPSYITCALAKRLFGFSQQCLARNFVDVDPDLIMIGVPAAMTAAERGTILEAYKKVYTSMINHPLRFALVDEPTAIGLGNHYVRTCSIGTVPTNPIVVFDCGGGTTDVAVLIPGKDKPFEILHPRGIRVAGDDLDNAIYQMVLRKLRKSPGSLNLRLLESNTTEGRRLLDQCRVAKENLSFSQSYTLAVSDYCGGFSNITLTREEANEAMRPIIQPMVDLTEEVLKASNLGQPDDLEIVLAGGSANIPLLQEMMRQRFPWVDSQCFTPRLGPHAVSMGAVIYGALMEQLPTRTTHGFAVEVNNDDNTAQKLLVVIPPNAKMPCSITSGLRTAFDQQTSCHLKVYEVTRGCTDELLEMNEGVETEYSLTHHFPHAVPLHTSLTLSTELTQDGLLSMVCRDKVAGGFTSEKQFTVSNMTQEAPSDSMGRKFPDHHFDRKKTFHSADQDSSGDDVLKKMRKALLNL